MVRGHQQLQRLLPKLLIGKQAAQLRYTRVRSRSAMFGLCHAGDLRRSRLNDLQVYLVGLTGSLRHGTGLIREPHRVIAA